MNIRARDNRIGAYRTRDVLEGLLANVSELDRDFPANLFVGGSRNANATRFGDALKPCRNVDAIAKNVIAVDDDVADIDADAEADLLFCDLTCLRHLALNGHGAVHRVYGAGELNKHPIAGRLDDTAFVFGNSGIDNLTAERLQRCQRAYLIDADQSGITRDISRQDCR